jgi:cytochrome c oxidase subunit 2
VLGAFVLGACGSDNSIVNPKGSEARHIANVWWLMFGLATFVYIVVAGFIVYASTRGRRRGGERSTLNADAFIWVGGIIVPALILAVLAVVTVSTTEALRKPSRNELHLDVTGHDWFWAIHYRGEDVTSANEIYLPAGQPVDIALRSGDVIHSFWVPQLAGKLDVVPGQTNHLRFTPNTVGTYIGQCAEYCGIQHALMLLTVVVHPRDEFARWVDTQRAPALDDPAAKRGRELFASLACINCHTVRGTSANGVFGPDLTHLMSRSTIGSGAAPNTPATLRAWVNDPEDIKAGARMPAMKLTRDELDAVTAYLTTLR